ncbi:MAG: DNA polymerase III subunit alpha [Oxalobacter sp.]|nr:DNA polymerase III subunit alpha [Oxalobacter sp.]
MTDPRFVHLRLHSEYSIVDGLVRIDEIVDAAAGDTQPAMALTDLSNLFGLIKFYKAARKKGIKPIAGCDVWITNDADREKPSRLLLLVRTNQGYHNLCELLTKAWLENQYKGRAEIRREWLADLKQTAGDTGLIALSGAMMGDIGQALEVGNPDTAENNARQWMDIFPGAFYLEVQRSGHSREETYIHQVKGLAQKTGLPVVATHPVQFLSAEQFRAHEARICIAEGEILANEKRPHLFNESQCFLTQEQMVELFADMPEALQNSVEIAKRCSLTLVLGEHKLPQFPTPPGMSLGDFMAQQAREGLEKRLVELFPDEAERQAKRKVYDERLAYEIDVIVKMDFPGYFLIVADFIQWAKNNGVPVGPGRGSGAGSLVAYSLLITNLDPIRYNLLFERFLNPERVSMPDFDIDFCQHGRDKVIQYVKDRYGHDAVSQIATFGTMAAKAAVRDVGRVLDLGYGFCDGISKLIPFKPGKQVTIKDALKEEPQLAEREKNEEEVHELLGLAEQVEGITRNVGMHAGGVLIAPGKLTDFCPLYTQGGDAGVVSHYDKKDVEEIGLVKFDFLGLTTLTILDLAVRYIREYDLGMADFSLDDIPLDDKPTFKLLTDAKTVSVFQLESRGMQGMLKDAKPDRFEDIIALVALYRPGPMELIPDYCRRKHGEAFEYPDERTKGILEETYGIMIYQEQVMQMAQIIGGYTLGGADLLRRAMGKKDPEAMAKHRQVFKDGAAKNNVSEAKADEIFDLMEKFAGYGFNKSHATAYALLSYQTAFLKCHHPAAFMAANMSLAMDDTDKVYTMVQDAQDVCGLTILPPDINESVYYFRPVRSPKDKEGDTASQIRYGLGAVKGTGESAVQAIVDGRASEPYKDLFDFCARVDRHQVNRRTIEALVCAGAFDSLGQDRGVLLASVGVAIEAAEQMAASANQASLFGDEETVQAAVEYADVPAWGNKQRLQEEKAVLGFCLTGHFFDSYANEAKLYARSRLNALKSSRDSQWLAGVVAGSRIQQTQRGRLMVVTLDDGTAKIEVSLFDEMIEERRQVIVQDEFLMVFGRVSEDRFSGGLRVTAEEVLNLEEARCHFGDYIRFSLPERYPVESIRGLFTPYLSQDGLAVKADYTTSQGQCQIAFSDAWRVRPTDECLKAFKDVFPDTEIKYH